MAQNFAEIPNGLSFSVSRDIINNSLAALLSNFRGESPPPSPADGQWWYRKSTGVISVYNGTVWVPAFLLSGAGVFTTLTATGNATIGTDSSNAHEFNGLATFNDGFLRPAVYTGSPGALMGINNYTFNGIGAQANAAQTQRRGVVPLPGAVGSIFKRARLRWHTGANTPAAFVTMNLLSITMTSVTTVPTTVATATDTANAATAEYRTFDFNPTDVTFAADTAYFLEIATTPGSSTNATLNALQIEMDVRD
jgi:hypothetical protein